MHQRRRDRAGFVVMDYLLEGMKACVYDFADGKAKAFGLKMTEEYLNIVRY